LVSTENSLYASSNYIDWVQTIIFDWLIDYLWCAAHFLALERPPWRSRWRRRRRRIRAWPSKGRVALARKKVYWIIIFQFHMALPLGELFLNIFILGAILKMGPPFHKEPPPPPPPPPPPTVRPLPSREALWQKLSRRSGNQGSLFNAFSI